MVCLWSTKLIEYLVRMPMISCLPGSVSSSVWDSGGASSSVLCSANCFSVEGSLLSSGAGFTRGEVAGWESALLVTSNNTARGRSVCLELDVRFLEAV